MESLRSLSSTPASAYDELVTGQKSIRYHWQGILSVIRALAAEGRTMILVTHEMKFAREVASHVIYLHNGAIEEQGPPDLLFGNPQSERLRQFLKNTH